jgi:hypothetical protein
MTIAYLFVTESGVLIQFYDDYGYKLRSDVAARNGVKFVERKKFKQNYDFIYNSDTKIFVHKNKKLATEFQAQLNKDVVYNLTMVDEKAAYIHICKDEPIICNQDVMTAMYSLYDKTSIVRDEDGDYCGTPKSFYDCLSQSILNVCEKLVDQHTGETMVKCYNIVFDKAENMSVLKTMTQLKRSALSKLYKDNCVLTEMGLTNPSDPDKKVIPFNIRTFMCSRSLRPQLYRYFAERFKVDTRFTDIKIVLDFATTALCSIYNNMVTEDAGEDDEEEKIEEGEADLGVIVRALKYRYNNVLIIGLDKDLYLISLLNAYRFPNGIHSNIIKPTYNKETKKYTYPLQHCNIKLMWEELKSRPGLLEAMMIIIMFKGTDFFQRRWIFESVNDKVIETTVIKRICYAGLNVFSSAAAFRELIFHIASETDKKIAEHHRTKVKGDKTRALPRCKINPDDGNINWAWMQMMNHMRYWCTLDDFFVIGDDCGLLPRTIKDLRNWKPYFECGFGEGKSKNPAPEGLKYKIYEEKIKAPPPPNTTSTDMDVTGIIVQKNKRKAVEVLQVQLKKPNFFHPRHNID